MVEKKNWTRRSVLKSVAAGSGAAAVGFPALVLGRSTGFLGQEFVPTRDPLASLEQGVRICNV